MVEPKEEFINAVVLKMNLDEEYISILDGSSELYLVKEEEKNE